ncbi:MAG: SRPBCC family protein [bacterium]
MKVYSLTREQEVSRPLSEVFAFFARPENLARLTPGTLGFEILTPGPLVMKAGTVIDYTLRIMQVPTHWRTLIETYEPPDRFVDIQLKGPYKFWHHTHSFTARGQGTLIRDEVHYSLPFGMLGRLVHSLWVRRQLEGIFDFRQHFIRAKFGGGG